MRHKRLTLYIFLWGMLAALVPVGLVFLLMGGPRDFFARALWVGLLFMIFCFCKIHSLCPSRSYYIRGDWRLTDLDDISGVDFEALTCDILASNGFELAESTKASGDFGVDVLAYRDGISFAIQCKRYNYDVGIEAVQQVYAGRAFYECHVAMVLTNQYFTPAARKLADKIGVVLWDRDMLERML